MKPPKKPKDQAAEPSASSPADQGRPGRPAELPASSSAEPAVTSSTSSSPATSSTSSSKGLLPAPTTGQDLEKHQVEADAYLTGHAGPEVREEKDHAAAGQVLAEKEKPGQAVAGGNLQLINQRLHCLHNGARGPACEACMPGLVERFRFDPSEVAQWMRYFAGENDLKVSEKELPKDHVALFQRLQHTLASAQQLHQDLEERAAAAIKRAATVRGQVSALEERLTGWKVVPKKHEG